MAAGNIKDEKAAFADQQQERLGAIIRALRKSRGYDSAEAFANEHHIGRAQMGRYEKGYNLTLKNLMWLIRELDMTPAEFFKEWNTWI